MKKLEDLWKKISWQLLHRKAVRYIAIALVILALGGVGLSKVNIEPANQGAKVKDQVEILGGEKTKEAGREGQENPKNDVDESTEQSLSNDKTTEGKGTKEEPRGKDTKDAKESVDAEQKKAIAEEKPNNQSSSLNTNPAEQRSTPSENTNEITVSLEIKCDSVSGENLSLVSDETARAHIQNLNNGEVLKAKVSINNKQSVYDALVKATQAAGIEMGASVEQYGVYVYEINYLREFMAGDNSGWMYSVNGNAPGFGCAEYIPKAGDKIVFYYVTSF